MEPGHNLGGDGIKRGDANGNAPTHSILPVIKCGTCGSVIQSLGTQCKVCHPPTVTKPEPSRLEIAAMFAQGFISSRGVPDIWMSLMLADELIDKASVPLSADDTYYCSCCLKVHESPQYCCGLETVRKARGV